MIMATYPELTPEIESIIADRYGPGVFTSLASDSVSDVAERLRSEAARDGRQIHRNIPSVFIESDDTDFQIIPQYETPIWTTLDHYLGLFEPRGGVLHYGYVDGLSLLPFHRTVRDHGNFMAAESPFNLPLAVEVVRQAQISFVVMPDKELGAFHEELVRRGVKVETVLLYTGIHDLPFRDADNVGSNIVREVHLFPGYPVLYQSFSIMGTTDTFHLDDRYLWEFGDDGTYITGIEKTAVPALRHKLPFTLRSTEAMSKLPAFILTPC